MAIWTAPAPPCGVTAMIDTAKERADLAERIAEGQKAGDIQIGPGIVPGLLDEIDRLRSERDEAQAERLEQARLLGMSGEGELAMRARLETAWRLLREGANLLADEADSIRAGITNLHDGTLSTDPRDAEAVSALTQIEDWIGRVSAMQPSALPIPAQPKAGA